jgi:hypothetical protein
MTLSDEMQRRVEREREQVLARLSWLEKHHQGIGSEAALLKRRLLLIEALAASANK